MLLVATYTHCSLILLYAKNIDIRESSARCIGRAMLLVDGCDLCCAFWVQNETLSVFYQTVFPVVILVFQVEVDKVFVHWRRQLRCFILEFFMHSAFGFRCLRCFGNVKRVGWLVCFHETRLIACKQVPGRRMFSVMHIFACLRVQCLSLKCSKFTHKTWIEGGS